jgi:hypothetical protein
MSALHELLGHDIVIDAISPYVFIGKLVAIDERYLVLEHADVHDLRDTKTSRDNYVADTRRLGIRANRERVLVKLDEAAALARLDAVIL